jgi:AcrR family transcriptional regulator
MRLRNLPEGTEYDDTPPWNHNIDNVEIRSLNAAWSLLLTKDVAEISFKEIAKEVRVTPNAIYYYYPTLTDLARELAIAATAKLIVDVCAPHPRGAKPFHAFRAFFNFAKRRPHHFSLLTSPRFAEHKALIARREGLEKALNTLLESALKRTPRADESHLLRLHLYGGGTLVASGTATVNEVMEPLSKTLITWRRTGKKKS